MAKKSVIYRNKHKQAVVDKYYEKRKELKENMQNNKLSEQEREVARNMFHALPRNASPCRVNKRCNITGRKHGVYRKFGLARTKLREYAMNMQIPGFTKASW